MSENKWRALEHCDNHKEQNDAEVTQEAEQVVKSKQESYEWIIVKDSEGVEVQTTDTQVAVSLQLALQIAIAIVISITILDSDKGKSVVQDLLQLIKTKQVNSQKTVIKGSKNICVRTTDTQVAANIQVLLQILVALVAKLDIA